MTLKEKKLFWLAPLLIPVMLILPGLFIDSFFIFLGLLLILLIILCLAFYKIIISAQNKSLVETYLKYTSFEIILVIVSIVVNEIVYPS